MKPWKRYRGSQTGAEERPAGQQPWERYGGQRTTIEPDSDPYAGSGYLGALTRGMESLGDGLTFDAAPYIRGAVRAVTGDTQPMQTERDRQRVRREDYTASTLINEFVGGAVTGASLANAGLTAMRFVPQGAPLAQRAAAVGTDAAAIGAVNSAMEGRDPGSGALLGMATGAGTTAALEPIMRGVGRAISRRAMSTNAPTTQELRAQSRRLYEEAERAGVAFDNAGYQSLARGIEKALAGEIDDTLHPGAFRVMQRIRQGAYGGQNPTLRELDFRRRNAIGVMMEKPGTDDARLAGKVVDEIERFVDSVPVSRMLSGGAGRQRAVDAARQARTLWRTGAKSQILEEALERAQNQASGFENGLRIQFRSILNNRKLSRRFNETELAAMKRVVRGGAVENFLKLLGRFGFDFGPSANMAGGTIGGTLGYTLAGPVGAAGAVAVGAGARRGAEAVTRGNAEYAGRLVRSGGRVPVTPQQALLADPRVQMLTAEALSGGALSAGQ